MSSVRFVEELMTYVEIVNCHLHILRESLLLAECTYDRQTTELAYSAELFQIELTCSCNELYMKLRKSDSTRLVSRFVRV